MENESILNKSCLKVAAIAAILFFASMHWAGAQALGAASSYNVYVLGNDTYTGGSDAMGAVAVGGNATFNSYSVGSALATGSAPNLVVGGTLTATGATINGSVFANNLNYNNPSVYGNVNGNSVNLSGYGNVYGNVSYGSSISNPNTSIQGTVSKAAYISPINFASTNQNLLNSSTQWSNIAATSLTVDYYNGITLSGSSNTLNVFNISGSQLSSENNLTINAPFGSTVLVNISGTSDSWGGGLSLNGVTDNDVIYNFSQATSLTVSGIGIDGTVLAPNAAVNFNGQINGNLIAGSLTGQGEAHNGGDPGNSALFSGSLPSGVSNALGAPEPSANLSLLLGVLAIVGLILSQRKQVASCE